MGRFITFFVSLLLAGAVLSQESAPEAAQGSAEHATEGSLPIFHEPPPSYKTIDTVSASSRDYSGRTRNGKRSYVIREMQRQAEALGGNALLITGMTEMFQVQPEYGTRRGSMMYRKVPLFLGAGQAIRVPGSILPADTDEPPAEKAPE